MDIPQNILDKFMVRPDYIEWIRHETSINVYIDFTNVLHWQEVLGWKFRIEDLVKQLLTYSNIKEIKIYYGRNLSDIDNSDAFHARIRKTGAVLRTKAMKFIQKEICTGMFFQRKTLSSLDGLIREKIENLVDELQKSGIVINEPKCNFDVEMAMDMLDDTDKITAIMLFSGDSDMCAPVERLKIKGKHICIVGVRGKVARELHSIKDIYFNFGSFYTGKKHYLQSENPAEGGTA